MSPSEQFLDAHLASIRTKILARAVELSGNTGQYEAIIFGGSAYELVPKGRLRAPPGTSTR